MKAAVIGGGLAGVECAKALSRNGITVDLYEMKPKKHSPAHKLDTLAELVCSNSLKAERLNSAAGLLKAEMAFLGSICVESAYECKVEAGGALAVDRYEFSRIITEKIEADENINIIHKEVTDLPSGYDGTVICAGPLASEGLSKTIKDMCGEGLSFFDAAAPIISADSIDMSCAFTQSRYDRGGSDDYINCPLNKEEYEAFYEAIITAQSAELHSFDRKKDVYEGCMPIEALAERGEKTLTFGPLKPVGFTDPRTGRRPYALLQLRAENANAQAFNLVGCQTKMTYKAQDSVFRLIPGLKNVEFLRHGSVHRNTYVHAPTCLNEDLAIIGHEHIYLAGQITGVEGYVESASCGLWAGIKLASKILEKPLQDLPVTTALGALMNHLRNKEMKQFQPSNIHFGLMPDLEEKTKKANRKTLMAERAKRDFAAWKATFWDK